MEQSLVLHLCT